MKNKIVKLLSFTKLKNKELENLIEIPKDIKLGDYSFPCFGLAKRLKKNPNEIARDIVDKMKQDDNFDKIESVGGYVNFFVNQKKFAKELIKTIDKEREKYGSEGRKEKIIIEICSPNTNKPLHLGHGRNIVLGQSIEKICKFMGNDVKIVAINSDRGVHICKSMIAYQKYGKDETPEITGKKSDHFVGDYYVRFAKESIKNKELELDALECLRKWEKGDKKTMELWKRMNSWALEGFKETYRYFDLKFDKEYYESQIYKKGRDIVLNALKKGHAGKKKDGAVFVDLSKKGLGEKILLRKDGTSIYVVQDLHLAQERYKDYNFDKMIYIVANEQDYHFKVLFELLKKFGYKWVDRLYHLSYGMVNLESGRMKSREGTVVDLDELVRDLKKISVKEIEKRYKKMHADEVSNRAFAIAMAALRYYLLKVDKARETLFNPKSSISFEGDTGPYLLYSYARALSILKKANYKKQKKFEIGKVEEGERKLINELVRFPDIVKNSYESLAPNVIANYSFSLAQSFNEFYHNCQVIGTKKEQFRLKLVDSFSQVIKNSLNLLGIPVIPEM